MTSIFFRMCCLATKMKPILYKPFAKRLINFHTCTALAKQSKKQKHIIQFKPKSQQPLVQLWAGITPLEIADLLKRDIDDVFEALSFVEHGDLIQDADIEIEDKAMVMAVAKRLGFRTQFVKKPSEEKVQKKKAKDLTKRPPPDPSQLVKRPPVVAIMGHVDHGKTTLLDALRHSSIVSREHGGITQHIGAFTVEVPQGKITFLDTPGHAAFHTMRARGAQATDFVILVVAADDGVMEQTVESVRFAREANVPIIVAINKIDKPNCNINNVKQGLLTCGIQVEDLGGDIQAVPISALKKINLDLLIEAILTQAEMMGVGGDPTGLVEGFVLESSIDTSRGKVSTALIERGTLKKGCFLVAGTAWARVRCMYDDRDTLIHEVTPGMACQIFGWKSFPVAGDIILEAKSQKEVNEVIKYRESVLMKEKMLSEQPIIEKKMEMHLNKYKQEREERLARGEYRRRRRPKEKEYIPDTRPFFSFVLKGDVHGSVEAILDVVSTYKSHDSCRLDVIHSGVGPLTESDITLAETFEGVIYTFNIDDISSEMKKLAAEKNVRIKPFNVIYHLIDDMKTEISNRLPLVQKEDVLGEATVLQPFLINVGKKKVPVAGCKCTNGVLKRNAMCKVVRGQKAIYNGSIVSLKHEKSDVESIKKDVECGLMVESEEIEFLSGDVIICYNPKSVAQVTDWNPGF